MEKQKSAYEIIQHLKGGLDEPEYYFEIMEAMYSLGLKEFYRNRDLSELSPYFSQPVPECEKEELISKFLELSFGEAILGAEDGSKVISRNARSTFYMLFGGLNEVFTQNIKRRCRGENL